MNMKIIKNGILILLSSILIGYFLLSFSYLVPTNSMKDNTNLIIDDYIQEEIYQEVNKYGNNGLLDNFTDSLMIATALNTNDNSIFIQSLENQRFYIEDIDNRIAIKTYINDTQQLKTINYNRYWHGYLIFLKPILYLTDYFTFRSINLFTQIILLLICFVLIVKQLNILYGLGYLGSIYVLQPYIISLSLQFTSIYYLTLIFTIIILSCKKLNETNSLYLFLLIGIFTSFFDLLTYPIITFGLPVLIYIAKNKKTNFIQFFKLGVFWAIGYLGMWLGKWVLTSAILQINIFDVVFSVIQMRTSSSAISENISRVEAVISNYTYGINKQVIIFNVLISLIILIISLFKKFKIKINKITLFPIILIIISPIVWFLVTSNHAYIHYFYTYRSISITIFGLYILILNNLQLGEYNE